MLHLGRVDVGLINEGVLQGLVQRGHAGFADTERYGVAPLSDHQPSRFHLLFTRTRPEGRLLQQRFDAEWARMQKNGEAQRLRERYLRSTP
jgi:ABC-type amino acid transport substrate-binding protein